MKVFEIVKICGQKVGLKRNGEFTVALVGSCKAINGRLGKRGFPKLN